jgi:AhpD family alkylhydroperoxidase
MKSPVLVVPEAFQALQALGHASESGGVPAKTLGLVHLRASQINGCGVCVDMHPRMMRKLGETDQRMFAVSAWRDAPYFTDAERAALALTEAVTRIADSSDPVPDDIWDQAAAHYDERGLATLLLAIVAINTWNRLNVATRQVAGSARAWE